MITVSGAQRATHGPRPRRRGLLARLTAAATAGVILVALTAQGATAMELRPAADDQPWMNTRLSADERANLVVKAMNLDQKVAVLVQSGGPGVPELGIPGIRGKDGCCGLSEQATPSTALPVGVALASGFDDELSRAYGAVAGEEARAAGYNHVAGPNMDLSRTPFNGRFYEALGEDPLLNGRTATAQVQGIQSQEVSALIKHYNLNNQEVRRAHIDETVDERTLQETYTRPWEKVVSESEPGAIMCAYNKVNGAHACSSDTLLNKILKDQLGFKGYVSSDFSAAHGFDDYAAGMDVAGPGIDFSGPNLIQAVNDGRVSQQRIDDAARRVLRTMFATGIIDNPPAGSFEYPQPTPTALPAAMLDENNKIAGQVAEQGIVLMKNEGGTLPLDSAGVGSLAVIGADADHYIHGGGSGVVPNPARLTTVLDGLAARAGEGVTVTHLAGTDPISLGDTLAGPAPVPSTVLTNISAEYRIGIEQYAGPAFLEREEKQVNLRTGLSIDALNTSQVPGIGFPLALLPLSARWTGTLVAPASGEYGLSLSHLGTARLYLDDELVLQDAGAEYGTQTAEVDLTEGREVDVRVEYTTDVPGQVNGEVNDQPGAMLRFGWIPPEGVISPSIVAAVEAARDADVAVVVARDYAGEGADRGTLTLPQDQDVLIREVVKANPRTIVVLNTGGPVTMPWIDDVPAVIEAWYGGQQQGNAVARVLYGDVNPSGKLPVTFPAADGQPSEIGAAIPEPAAQGDITIGYDDGIHVGYKGYLRQGVEPLFPFGHGLSYTQFEYSQLKTKKVDTRGNKRDLTTSIDVTVANTGERDGADVVQVYVGPLPTSVDTPERQLAGYARVTLRAGKTQKVAIELDKRALQYWDVEKDAWVTPTGKVPVYVGTSLAGATLAGTIEVK
jgi:beta-glucosidase